MNWFLYLVTETFEDDGVLQEAGSKGVGMCSMQPGIMEAPYGVMYVIPEDFVDSWHIDRRQSRYCVSLVEDAVSAYYGIKL